VPVTESPEQTFLTRVAALPAGRRWWLDSAQAGPLLGRYSFAGAEPYACFEGRATAGTLEVFRDARPDFPPPGRHAFQGPSLPALAARLPAEMPSAEDGRVARQVGV